jgi:L-ribulose-5-phosphate 3-epimerase
MSSAFAPFAVDTLSYAHRHSLNRTIDLLSAAGCHAVQLSLHPGFLWPSEIAASARTELRKRIEACHLRVVSVNLPGVEINVASVSPEMRGYSIDLLRQNIELAGDLGAAAVVMTPGRQHPLVPLPRAALMTHFFAALDALVPIAAGRGVTLCIENAPSSFLPDAGGVIGAVDAYGSNDVGICYDMPNGHFITERIDEALRTVKSRLKLLHVADTGQDAHRHAAVGQGSIAFAELYPVLAEIGHAELPVLEVISSTGEADMIASAENLLRAGWGDGPRT